jgi:hypothetical protein
MAECDPLLQPNRHQENHWEFDGNGRIGGEFGGTAAHLQARLMQSTRP